MSDLDELYQDLLLDHFRSPRCKGCLDCADVTVSMHNPLCGDNIQLMVQLCDKESCDHAGCGMTRPDSALKDVKFTGSGCSISQASTSIMTELIKGKTVGEIQVLSALFHRMMKEELPDDELIKLGDAAALVGVRRFSARIRCALLGWDALDKCLKELIERTKADGLVAGPVRK